MRNAIFDAPLLKHPKPWWQPLFTVLITLYGIVFNGWNLQPIIFLFWWEAILIIGSALIRMLFALDGRPIWATVFTKIGCFLGVFSWALL